VNATIDGVAPQQEKRGKPAGGSKGKPTSKKAASE